MRRKSSLRALISVALVACAATSSATAEPSYYEQILLEKNVAPTAEGLRTYLEQLRPSADQAARAAQFIRNLGAADSFAKREAAMNKLLIMPTLPIEALTAAGEGDDPEIRWRARRVLEIGGPQAERVLYAVLKTIEQNELHGLAGELLKTIPLCDKTYLQFAARTALRTTALASDGGLLRSATAHENAQVRWAAVDALSHVVGREAAADLEMCLDDRDDRVKLAAARAVANYGGRASLAALAQLLSSQDIEVRMRSAEALLELTGQQIDFVANDSVEKREAAIEMWGRWIATNGKSAKLSFPLTSKITLEIGHTLISAYTENRIIELDANHNERRVISGYSGPWGVVPLPNGNLLVNWYGSSCVVEYDANGKEVWKFQKDGVQYPWSAVRLPNGNTLIAHSNVAIEVNPSGKTVWQAQFEGTLSHALRLDNGNTLAALVSNNKVVEVNPRGEVLWTITDLRQPYRIQRLTYGNTLVADKGNNRVVEFDASGKRVVWSREELSSPDCVQRLGNGNTLISDSQFIREIDPTGKTVWQSPCAQCLVWRY